MIAGTYAYTELDESDEAARAVARMQFRAEEPASEQMFEKMVAPLLTPSVRRILEIGCGTGALARRMSERCPLATIVATDKSARMVHAARELSSGRERIAFRVVDATQLDPWPFDENAFDLIVSSVAVPYLDDAQTERLISVLSERLSQGGVLAFLEQDLRTDSLYFPDDDLLRRVYAKDARELKRTIDLGLRPLLRQAGLVAEPLRAFLWTDETYGPYVRDLVAKLATDALAKRRIDEGERAQFLGTLEQVAASGGFYYGLVYHLIAGVRAR